MILLTSEIITTYAKSVIIQIGLAAGLILLIGFMAMLHEVWKRHAVSKAPVIATAMGKLCLILGLLYFPDQLYLVAPFSLATLAWGMFYAVGYIRRLAKRIETNTIYDEDKTEVVPFMTTTAKWSVIVAIIALTLMTFDRQSNTLASVAAVSDSTKNENTKVLNGINNKLDKTNLKVDHNANLLASQTSATNSLSATLKEIVKGQPVASSSSPKGKQTRNVMRSVSFKPIETDTLLKTGNKPAIPVDKTKKDKPKSPKTFLGIPIPFTMRIDDDREILNQSWGSAMIVIPDTLKIY